VSRFYNPETRASRYGSPEEGPVAERARGTFEVKLSPATPDEKLAALGLGRMSFEKTLHGDFEGTSRGEMVTAGTAVEGSAAYVAVERYEGSLRGRRGSFLVVHRSTMRRGGSFDMSLVTVPDSGTGELAGLEATIKIAIEGGQHSYELDYELPATDRSGSGA
jgi:Protein of unknown function (DUF3224)